MLGLAPSSSYRPHGGMAPNHALHLTGALTDSEHRQVSADRRAIKVNGVLHAINASTRW